MKVQSSKFKVQRTVSIFLTLFFLFQTIGGIFLYTHTVSAQVPITDPAGVAQRTAIDTKKTTWEKVKETTRKIISETISSSFYRTVMNFTARISGEVGKNLASGGEGGKPLFDTRSFKSALSEAGEAAIGDALDEIAAKTGVNLCLPPDIRLNLSVQLFKTIEPDKPKCTFQKFQEEWKNFGDQFSGPGGLNKLNAALNPSTTEVGLTMQAILDADAKKGRAEEEERLQRLATKGWKAIEDPIAKTVKTPASMMEAVGLGFLVPEGAKEKEPKLTGDLYQDAPKVALYNFFAAFTSTAIQRLMKGIFAPTPSGSKRRGLLATPGSGGSSSSGSVRSSVTAVNFAQSGGEFDLLTEFTTCPAAEGGAFQGTIYNCVLDQGFAEAIRSKLSVKEAIERDLLHGNWPFGFWGSNADQPLKFDQGYALHNLKKIRRARIIPVGWELAAEVVRNPNAPKPGTTLNDVVNGFDDRASPFYRLVDPNWVLTAPLYSCRVKAPGELVNPGTPDRLEYCVDLQDCVVPTADGNGCQSWGYCTREKNVWRFDGKSCEPQFNTCTFYTRTGDGASFSFLRNTLDFCDASAVGCRWYSTEQSGDQWTVANNKKIFFNRNVDPCTADSAGCRQFVQLKKSNEQNRLFTPAEYRTAINVAVAQPETTTYTALPYADLPNTTMEVVHLKKTRLDCRGDGAQGEAEEANVGCERYSPSTGLDPAVPAVLTSADECLPICVGYDSFKQVATPFSQERFPVYFKPKTARTCSAEQVGCEEFTNLDAVERRGEAREYFTSLRQCQKPATDSKTYFTWIGTETTGYQLQVHSLKASNLDGGRAPCTNRRMEENNVCADSASPENRALCTKAETVTNPDCREFYDEAGNISYRLLSRTILSHESCVRYRRTIVDDLTDTQTRNFVRDSCRTTGGGWDDAAGTCTYLAYPPENKSCTAAARGCREYKGNTANDLRLAVNETFEVEDAWKKVWNAGTSSTVSVTSGGRSLNVSGATVLSLKAGEVKLLRTYLVNFWARGAGNLSVTLASPQGTTGTTTATTNVPLSSQWREYTFGPIFITSWPTNGEGRIIFTATALFLDNVRVKEVRDDFFLIENSWKTPSECEFTDATPPVYRPGLMAGCREYTDRTNKKVQVKSFSKICEERFVGCEALIDTQNSTPPQKKEFNTGPDRGTDADDVTIEKDALVYVVNDPAQYCGATEKGCDAFGNPPSFTQSTAFPAGTATKYWKNNPDDYSRILCIDDDLGCEAYKNSKGREGYFQDPQNKTCDWKRISGTTQSLFGWFQKGTTSATPDCGKGDDDGSTVEPGFVRSCPSSENFCSKFIDPQDNAGYYVIDDQTLDSKRAECIGASVKEGCILFRNTNLFDTATGVVDRIYNAQQTYKDSEDARPTFTAVVPSDSGCTTDPKAPGCDANDFLKVKRDRACGEWLTCVSGAQVFDKQTQTKKNVCYALGRCTTPSSHNASECGAINLPDADPKLLNLKLYTDRNVQWAGQEYAGYSIPYRYPVSSLTQLPYAFDPTTKAPTEFRLSNLVLMDTPASCKRDADCAGGQERPDRKCRFGGLTIQATVTGRCYQDKGTGTKVLNEPVVLPEIARSCRAYPAADAPFPPTVVEAWNKPFVMKTVPGTSTPGKHYFVPEVVFKTPTRKKIGFEEVNVAQSLPPVGSGYTYTDGDCSYKQVRYKTGDTRFWGVSGYSPPILSDEDDQSRVQEDIRVKYGWKGFCLESDESRSKNGNEQEHACLTWFPIDLVQGEVDVNSNFPEAGYTTDPARRFYCVDTERQEYHQTYRDDTKHSYYTCAGGYYESSKSSYKENAHDRQYRHFCTPVGGDGWYPEGEKDTTKATNARLLCKKFALVTDPATDRNYGWTERLMGPDAIQPRTYTVPDLNYTIETALRPYGAADIGVVDVAANKFFLFCTGSTTENGKSCVTPEDRDRCLASGGKCDPILLSPYRNEQPYVPSPYAKTSAVTLAEAVGRLQNVFARGFGIWEFQGSVNACVNRCEGGIYNVQFQQCTTSANCPGDVRGTCVSASTYYQGQTGIVFCPDGTTEDEAETRRCVRNDAKYCQGSPNDEIECTTDSTLCDGAGQCMPVGGQCSLGTAAYAPIPSTLPVAWNFTGPENQKAAGPEVRAALFDSTTQTYKEGPRGLTIDTTSSGDITRRGTALPIALKFYGYNKNGNQMPLRRVAVNWGDGTNLSVSKGSLKNHKDQCQRYCSWSVDGDGNPTIVDQSIDKYPAGHAQAGAPLACTNDADCPKSGFCNTDPTIGECRVKPKQCATDTDCGGGKFCRIQNWGDEVDACVQDAGDLPGYFVYTHTYQCMPGSQFYEEDTNTAVSGNQPGCVFVPRVQILDNWDWCNGTCDGINGKGCYGRTICDSETDARPWTRYGGTIILRP